MSVWSCIRYFQMKWVVCASESHWRGWHLHRAINSNISNPRFGKNMSPLYKSLSISHVSLRSPFSLSVNQTWWPTQSPRYCSEAPEHCTQPILLPHHSLFCPVPHLCCHARVCTGQRAVLSRALIDYRAIWAISYSCFTYVALEEFSTERRSNTEWQFQHIFLKKT